MAKYPSDSQDKFVLRLPDGMRDRIKAAADENGRSMNSEIVATLEDAYPEVDPEAAILEMIQHIREMSAKALPPERLQDFDAYLDGIAIEVKGRGTRPDPEG